MKKLLMLALCAVSFNSFAYDPQWNDDEWMEVTGDGVQDYWMRKGSLNIAETNGGEKVVAVDGQIRENGNIKYYKWYVEIAHCANKQGDLVITDMDGRVLGTAPFVFERGVGVNTGHIVATFICETYEYALERDRNKTAK